MPRCKGQVAQKEPGNLAGSSLGYQQQGSKGLCALKLLLPKSKEKAMIGSTGLAGAGQNASPGCKEEVCQKEPGSLAESSPSHQQEGRGAGNKISAKMLRLPKKKEMAMASPKS